MGFLSTTTGESFVHVNMIYAGNGRYCFQKDNGMYISIQPDGSMEERKVVGPWERGIVTSKCVIFDGENDPAFAGKSYGCIFTA